MLAAKVRPRPGVSTAANSSSMSYTRSAPARRNAASEHFVWPRQHAAHARRRVVVAQVGAASRLTASTGFCARGTPQP
ncbi:MAG: hypothetical protein M5U30_18815 [Burkholderiaceae bacterium]|nr:hypothetical protein [Burkholderiaceae bacterium]